MEPTINKLSLDMLCRGVGLRKPLLQPCPVAHAEADLEGLGLNRQARGVGVALERARQDRSLRRVRGRRHLECDERAHERDVHLPVRQVRAGAHARARAEGEVLRPRAFGDVQEALWAEFVGGREMVRVEVGRPGVL